MTSREVAEHWIGLIADWVAVKKEHEDMAVEITSKFANWELKDVPLEEILSVYDTSLELDYFFNERVKGYINKFGSSNIPAVVLVPVGTSDIQLLIPSKLNSNIKWEPADGRHRVVLANRLGLKTIKGYIPSEEIV